MARDVLRDGVEKNLRRIIANADFAGVLQTGRLIRWPLETHGASGTLREDCERIHPVIECGGYPIPVLLVVIAFRQRPDLIPAIVDPAAIRLTWGNVLSFVYRIHEQ